MIKNRIVLTAAQREEFERFSKTGVHSARLINRAKIILLLDTSENKKAVKFKDISRLLNVSMPTITKVRNEFCDAESVSAFLQRKKRETPPVAPKVTGDIEAHIIALACGEPPEGRDRWTLRLLSDKSVELGLIGSISYRTVGSLLKKHNLSLT
jgi:hypothetical protein